VGFVFIPLIFYALYKIYKHLIFRLSPWAFSYAGLILSHNLVRLWQRFYLTFSDFINSFKKDKKTAVYLGLPVLLGILISLFIGSRQFWKWDIPMWLRKRRRS